MIPGQHTSVRAAWLDESCWLDWRRFLIVQLQPGCRPIHLDVPVRCASAGSTFALSRHWRTSLFHFVAPSHCSRSSPLTPSLLSLLRKRYPYIRDTSTRSQGFLFSSFILELLIAFPRICLTFIQGNNELDGNKGRPSFRLPLPNR